MGYLMSVDLGTSSSRVIIFDTDGCAIATGQKEFDSHYPHNGWVEQDPEEIWSTTLLAGRTALENANLKSSDILAMGITNQRETTVLWDAISGVPEYPAIVWQDRRTAEYCELLRSSGKEALVSDITGLLVDPYFSSTKINWILHSDPCRSSDIMERAVKGQLKFGTLDSYLIWRFTNTASHKTDASNASRTQLFDIRRQCWSNELLDLFDIPEQLMPEVCDSAADFGCCSAEWFGSDIPIMGVAGDQQAALIGQACLKPGMTKATYGTGCFVITNTGGDLVRSGQRLLSTVAYRINGVPTYAIEGSIFVAGVAIRWLRDQLGLIEDVAETLKAAESCNGDTGGVYLIPAFTGLGAPHWKPDARGMLCGLSLETSREQIITAALQSVAFQTDELLKAMAEDGAVVTCLRIDGGMVVNDWMCQFLADILNVDVERPVCIETTALGAAMLAGVGLGLFADLDTAARNWRVEKGFSPALDAARRRKYIGGWAESMRSLTGGL